MCCCDFILVLLALVFPPLPVWIKCGICSAESVINICLCLLGYLPGVVHAIYIIAKYPIQYVVLDEESQLYVAAAGGSPRQRAYSPVVIQAGSPSPGPSQAPAQQYGSMNPPPYSIVDQAEPGKK